MNKPAQFLILCNPRTGSSWLQTMLGSYPGIHSDFELKWKPLSGTRRNPLHIDFSGDGFDLASFFSGLDPDARCVGSKLVLGTRPYTDLEYAEIASRIPRGIKLIHLHRDYSEVILSTMRPGDHWQRISGSKYKGEGYRKAFLEKPANVRIRNHKEKLDESIELLILKSISRSPEDFVRYKQAGIELRDYLSPLEWDHYQLALKEEKFFFPVAGLSSLLRELISNDLFFQTLGSDCNYLSLNYSEIPERMGSILEFLGIETDPGILEQVVRNPFTSKVVNGKPCNMVYHYENYSFLCAHYYRMALSFQNLKASD